MPTWEMPVIQACPATLGMTASIPPTVVRDSMTLSNREPIPPR
jgi:hypothetical protein